MDQPVFSLLQVMQSIRRTIAGRYTSAFWVRAEMNKLNHYSHSGHCYPELVEKENGKVVAQVNATLWRDDFLRADKLFRQTLNEPLRDGIKILFKAKISFDPAHGLSLNIIEIDPAFTLGDLEREKKETLEKLKSEGLLEANRKLKLPLLPQRIAVISVETSKGYADFLSVINGNQWGYKFFHMLFPSILQGEKAVDGITGQLKRIRKVIDHFDVVAIIRGGGGDVGLSVYNDYRIASAIASYPIPVLSGIGHATNLTASEMVSHAYAITPTKLADMLLQQFHETAVPLRQASRTLGTLSTVMLGRKNQKLSGEAKLFKSVTANLLARASSQVNNLQQGLSRESTTVLSEQNMKVESFKSNAGQGAGRMVLNSRQQLVHADTFLHREARRNIIRMSEALAYAEGQIAALDPANVLRRGFSITRYHGKAVRDALEIPVGEEFETELSNGVVKSRKTS